MPIVGTNERLLAREEYGVTDRFVVLYLANFRPGKGHTHLPEIIQEVARRVPNVQFVLAGEMRKNSLYRETVRSFQAAVELLGIGHRVQCLGFVSETRRLLAAADVLLALSEVEGMSNSLMEAMALGLPVVTTDAGGAGELIRPRIDGWLVPRENRLLAVEALVEIARNAELGRIVGGSARERVLSEFSVESMVAAYVHLFEELTGRSRSGRF